MAVIKASPAGFLDQRASIVNLLATGLPNA